MSATKAVDEDIIPAAEMIEGKGGAAPSTLMEQLREKREQIASTRTTNIPIPGFEDFDLEARYRLVDRHEIDQVGKNILRQTKDRGERMMLLLVDTLVLALDGFLGPIRERYSYYENHRDEVKEILDAGTKKTRAITQETLAEIKEKMGILSIS